MNGNLLVPVCGAVLMMPAFLAGCVQRSNYAPVTVTSQTITQETSMPFRQKPVLAEPARETAEADRIVSPNSKMDSGIGPKYYVVQYGDTLYSIGRNSGVGFQRLAQWNRLSPPYEVEPGQRLQLFQSEFPVKVAALHRINDVSRAESKLFARPSVLKKKPQKPVDTPVVTSPAAPFSVAKTTSGGQEKKANISINNKKMLKLSFAWPIKGRIARNFNRSTNKGIDIAGKIGQKVRAAEAGTIAYSGQGLIGYGNLVIIKHNDLYLSAYGNNSRLLVKEGEQVEKGQAIAQVGRSLSKKTALHFEIRKKGKPVNPLKLLPKSASTLAEAD